MVRPTQEMKRRFRLVRSDVGETLVEITMSVMLLGLCAAAMLGSLMVLIASSVFSDSQSHAQNALYDWASTVQVMQYQDCLTGASVLASAPPPDLASGLTPSVTFVHYWDGTSYASTCPPSDLGTAQIRLTITAPAAGYPASSKSLDVVIRKPCESGC